MVKSKYQRTNTGLQSIYTSNVDPANTMMQLLQTLNAHMLMPMIVDLWAQRSYSHELMEAKATGHGNHLLC